MSTAVDRARASTPGREVVARASPRRDAFAQAAGRRVAACCSRTICFCGDTLMLTPLIAKLRERSSEAEIAMTVPRAIAPLYSTQPLRRARAGLGSTRDANSRALPGRPFDLRHSSGRQPVCVAGGSDAFALDRRLRRRPNERRNWPVDELTALSGSSRRMGRHGGDARRRTRAVDLRAHRLAGAGGSDRFAAPAQRLRVLHVGAARRSSCGRRTGGRRSRHGSRRAASRRYGPPGAVRSRSFAPAIPTGDTRRMRAASNSRNSAHLLASARLLVAPDTGVAHLRAWSAFRPSRYSARAPRCITGAGDFWRDAPYQRGHRRSVPVPRPARFSSAAKSNGCAVAGAREAECPRLPLRTAVTLGAGDRRGARSGRRGANDRAA